MLTNSPHHIIAIGASAGGMEELKTFFDNTPLDGVCYVIVQHLSPDFKSSMAQLLARHSKLAIKEAENEMQVESNIVYLIPNDKFMTIARGKLHLTVKEKGNGPNLTVNRFFNSLAADCGKKAIGIILSGLGSDGTEGVTAIKQAGGMVIVRNPETTSFAGMPSNAIATGLADFILEPAAMPATIENYVNAEQALFRNKKDDEKNSAIITGIIKQQSPLDFTDYKQSTILRRIIRRAAYNKFTRLEDYIEFLKSTPGEIETLAKDFLISVTAFFRDKEAFDFIQSDVIPDLLKKLEPEEELKLWVAGCATGEEVYSLAILLHEQLTREHKNTVVKIFATDIDNIALLFAGKGIYNGGIAKDVSAERLEKYFIKADGAYQVKPAIRRMVIFAKHDLVKNPPYCNMHFISCRNLLIYMTPVLQKKVFLMLLFGLKMEGYLFLGSSENPMPIIQNLEVVNKKWKIYKNMETKRFVRFDAFSLPVLVDKKSTIPHVNREEPLQSHSNHLTEAVNELLVNDYGKLVVCIDENNHVIKTYGDTTRFLLQKNFTLNLVELLPTRLAVAFSTLSSSVLKANEKETVTGIEIKHENATISISMSVAPLMVKKGTQKLLMVTFSEEKMAVNAGQKENQFDEKIYLDQYTRNIQEELNELKDKLNRTYAELDASNENMQSFNEELLSANEEMQSTNEEMQSVNEELHTINADYQLKNKELLDINDDLNNYFRSNINGQLFVNNEMMVMKFSPGTVKQINLLPTDIGRPLSNISTNIKFETLTADIKYVIANGGVVTKEIETDNGRWYQVNTMPYLQQAGNKINGAIITFNDITDLKKMQLELDDKNECLLRINADLENFVNTASHDLLGPLGNIEFSIRVMNEVKVVDPELNNFLTIINASVKKFRSLVTDIGKIAKIESDMIVMEMVDIEELLNNIEWSLDDKILASKAVINRQLEVKEILFSKKNLRSILYNLISNSIKFRSKEPPVINLQTVRQGKHVILSVQDNGIGMDEANQSKIFDMYGRINREAEGQGIGLYLAKKIVDAANGKIEVESEPGKGSRFIIYLKTEA